MRKLFILLVAVVLGLYCWKAAERNTLVDVPGYSVVTVDLLNGKTLRSWDDPASATKRAEYLSVLESRHYQPLEGGLALPDGTAYAADKTLHAKDYEKIVQALRNGTVEPIKLRDPGKLYAMDARRYVVRNPMTLTLKDGKTLVLKGGEKLNKHLLDQILESQTPVVSIGVVGNGDVVAPQLGTIVMVILIFLALVMGLKDAMWDPLLAILDARKKEIEEGAALNRKNRDEHKRLEQERQTRFAAVRRDYLDQLAGVQREAMKEADKILAEARHEANKIRDEANKTLDTELKTAESELRKGIARMTADIVTQILGRAPRGN